VKTEADDNDITECSHDDKPVTGMFGLLSFNMTLNYMSCITRCK